MMKKILYIFLAAVVALTACRQIETDSPLPVKQATGEEKVLVEFNIALPTDGPSTKAMGNKPEIKNIVLAVFGGSGYFNEWVPADSKTVMATENEVIYKLSAKLSMSESRLRVHVIANCPEAYVENPPITGISSEDLEEVVLSKVRSKITEANNDGYWQKFYLPYGIAAEIDPNGNGEDAYLKDAEGNLIPTVLTVNQFKMISPIPLVRNFARIRLQNLASDVTIHNVGLVNAPAEGVIAPILSTPYRVDEWGARVSEVETGGDATHDGTFTVYPVKADRNYGADIPAAPNRADYEDDASYNTAVETYNAAVAQLIAPGGIGIHVLGHELKNATTNADILGDAITGSVYNESFLTNYQNLPMKAAETDADGNTYKLITDAPYSYAGTAAANLEFASNPTSDATGKPATGFVEYDPNGYLYVYERPKPRTFSGKTEKATRIIIYATKAGESPKYYALDILNQEDGPEKGQYLPLLRNFTYDVTLTGIAVGSGETTAEQAADATGANVSGDPRTQDLNEVSDGVSTIRVSYVDITYIRSGIYYVYYQFIPDIKSNAGQSNKDVTIDWGYDGGEGGYVAHAVSANGSPFAMTAATTDEPNGVPSNLKIEMSGTSPKLYVPDGNDWKEAETEAEKAAAWSRIEYTTTGTAGEAFNVATFGTIRVTGARANGSLYRDVRVNVIPKKNMTVRCAQKYVQSLAGQSEDYVIRIPADITRSMFPLEFKIEAESGSLTPRDGDNLPVSSGKSIVSGKETRSTFFFIKTLTRQEYDALPDIIEGQNVYKEFTCHFKTTKAANATTIYAYNEYFNLAWDDFKNFKQRLFTTDPTSLGDFSIGQEKTLTLIMDNASRTNDNDNNMVWDNAAGGFTDSNQVIPHEVKITMVGIQPKTDAEGHIADAGLTASPVEDGVYYYQPTASGTRPGEYTKQLHLVVESGSEDNYSITFSTATCDNPDLYAPLTLSGRITKSQITPTGFTNNAGTVITSVKKEAGLPVQFRFTYGGVLVPVTFKLQGLSTTDSRVSGPDAGGVYTFTPTGTAKAQVINFTTTDANTQCRLYDFAVTDDSYNQPSPNNFSLKRVNGHYSISLEPGNTAYGWTSSTVNPDSDQYYAYQSTNNGVNSSIATMSVTIVGYEEFTVYIRSYAESSYDYVVVRNLDVDPLTSWSNTYNGTKATTQSNQQSGTAIGNYTAVTFTTTDGLTGDDTPHTFYIQYGKDGSTHSYDDRGYVLIPREYNYQYIPVAVTGISLDPTSATIGVGATVNLTATVTPENADDKTVSWTSSNNSVATVDENGVVTGVATGTATITATAGGQTATCEVTVVINTTVTVNTNSTTITGNGNRTINSGDIRISFSNVRSRGEDYVQLNDNSNISITASGKVITSIIVHYYSDSGVIYYDGGYITSSPSGYYDNSDHSIGTWTGSATSITLQNGIPSKYYTRISSVEITYE